MAILLAFVIPISLRTGLSIETAPFIYLFFRVSSTAM